MHTSYLAHAVSVESLATPACYYVNYSVFIETYPVHLFIGAKLILHTLAFSCIWVAFHFSSYTDNIVIFQALRSPADLILQNATFYCLPWNSWWCQLGDLEQWHTPRLTTSFQTAPTRIIIQGGIYHRVKQQPDSLGYRREQINHDPLHILHHKWTNKWYTCCNIDCLG